MSVTIIVYASKGKLKTPHKSCRCAVGKNGFVPGADGVEGDGKTPLGRYALRYGFYRSDRLERPTGKIAFLPVRKNDGWCDEPGDPAYNRPVRFPYPASAEKFWRESSVYDIIIVLGHNDSPPEPNRGSAIFLHLARKNYTPTQGCVAIGLEDMLEIIPHLTQDSTFEIKP